MKPGVLRQTLRALSPRRSTASVSPTPTAEATSDERDAGGSLLARMHGPEDDGSPGPDLTPGDIEFFKANGYLFKRGLIDPATLQGCVDHFWRDLPPSVDAENVELMRRVLAASLAS